MFRFILILAATCALYSHASAAVTYRLDFTQSSLALAPGQSATLGILFTETAIGSPHAFDLTPGPAGLISASFRIETLGAGGSTITGATGNNLFDLAGGPNVVVGATTTFEQDVDFASEFVFATTEAVVPGGTSRSVQVGTATFTASNVLGDTNVFSLADFDIVGSQFVIDGGPALLELDDLMSFGQVTVTAVPEPSSIAVLAVMSGLGAYRMRRRVAKAKAEPVTV